MNREIILKHSKFIRLNNQMLQDFIDVMAEYCAIKGHPEHLSVIIQLLQQPMIGEQIIDKILEYFEKEYHIIKLERMNTIDNVFGSIENKQLINIY